MSNRQLDRTLRRNSQIGTIPTLTPGVLYVMSILFFPPERKSDNLAYLIFPTSFVVFLHSLGIINLEGTASIGGAVIGVSALALFLYITAPVDIYLRRHTRGKFQGRRLERLAMALNEWYFGPADRHRSKEMFKKVAKTWISNAISSYALRQRFGRIRVLYYFGISCGFYVFALAVFLTGLLPSIGPIAIYPPFINTARQAVYCPATILGTAGVWLFLYLVYRGRRVYGSYLYRDIAYVAEYLAVENLKAGEYRTLVDGGSSFTQPTNGINAVRMAVDELRHFGNMLLRGDLDTFSTIWGNQWSKIRNEKNQPRRETQDTR